MLAATSALFTAVPRQRCLVHKHRNVMNAIPYHERQQVAAELAEIWKQEKKEDAGLQSERCFADITSLPFSPFSLIRES